MKRCFRLFVLLSAIACASLKEGRSEAHVSTDEFFPKNTFMDLTYDSFLVDVFKKHLRQLAEPRLNASLDDVFAIRCLWMSPYKGDELVRIESRRGEKPFAVYKRTEVDRDGNSFGHRVRKTHISRQAILAFAEQVEHSGVMDLSNTQDVISSDGPIWMAELYSNGRYHAVYRTDPGEGVFRKTCESVAKIANAPLDIQ
jgi:hypothetical protein